ncbi:unnamed protein product [Cuscuta europaea]|uniref:Uncharacterized protein n=1 Tax=Cuscuta europaea TaxID=41803 RepID=A0A9P0Z4S3_CUSEU|nr:unnamed protein product [Cuscuta europaea]
MEGGDDEIDMAHVVQPSFSESPITPPPPEPLLHCRRKSAFDRIYFTVAASPSAQFCSAEFPLLVARQINSLFLVTDDVVILDLIYFFSSLDNLFSSITF